MSKKIQAYFQTENDALSANTRIQAYGAEYLEVSELPDAIGRDSRLLIPFAAGVPISGTPGSSGGFSTAASGMTNAAGNPAAAYMAIDDSDGSLSAIDDDSRDGRSSGAVESDYYDGDRSLLRYVMAATVKDEVYADVVKAIRRNGGYVEVFD